MAILTVINASLDGWKQTQLVLVVVAKGISEKNVDVVGNLKCTQDVESKLVVVNYLHINSVAGDKDKVLTHIFSRVKKKNTKNPPCAPSRSQRRC